MSSPANLLASIILVWIVIDVFWRVMRSLGRGLVETHSAARSVLVLYDNQIVLGMRMVFGAILAILAIALVVRQYG